MDKNLYDNFDKEILDSQQELQAKNYNNNNSTLDYSKGRQDIDTS